MKVFIVSDALKASPGRSSSLKHPKIAMDDIGCANVGDYFTTTLNNGKTVRFDCVDRRNGRVRFDSHDCIIRSKWNEHNTSKGGYLMSQVNKSMDYVWDLLPEDLQDVIVETPRLYFDGEEVRKFATMLFIPDEGELFDDDAISNYRLYAQLDWYKDRRNRMKGEAFGKDAADYWTSSPH